MKAASPWCSKSVIIIITKQESNVIILNLNQIVLNAFGTNDVKDLFYPHLILRMFWDIDIVLGTHVIEYFSISAGPKVFDIWL